MRHTSGARRRLGPGDRRRQVPTLGPSRTTRRWRSRMLRSKNAIRRDRAAPRLKSAHERGAIEVLTALPVVIHERIGNWARQLRPRLSAWPIRLVESRSTADLEAAVARTACPILVLDLARRPRAGLEDLDRAIQAAPRALALVLDSESHEGVATLAREIGAVHVFSGVVTPPTVALLISRWISLAQRRTENDGWSIASKPDPEPEPWNWLAPYLIPERPASGRASRL